MTAEKLKGSLTVEAACGRFVKSPIDLRWHEELVQNQSYSRFYCELEPNMGLKILTAMIRS